MDLKAVVRDVVDFPKEGIIFKDITTILHDPDSLQIAVKRMGRQP